MILGIMEILNEWGEQFQGFMLDNSRNPVVWIGLFLLGLVVFGLTYSALNKHR